MSGDLATWALRCVRAAEAEEKVRVSREAVAAWQRGRIPAHHPETEFREIEEPGYPERLALVPPTAVPRRNVRAREGRAALIHALMHIEFSAISLAWDAVYRFPGLPEAYYADWIQVAAEEVEHFSLLQAHLESLGYRYGDFPAHAGLWQMARDTAHDWLARMAMVPRTLEARGLDVTPGILAKLAGVGDDRAVAILQVVQREEIGHVAAGNRWFGEACARQGLEPAQAYRTQLEKYLKGRLKPPFNHEARLAAGFSAEEMRDLEHWLAHG